MGQVYRFTAGHLKLFPGHPSEHRLQFTPANVFTSDAEH
jgi:hypothetical protein